MKKTVTTITAALVMSIMLTGCGSQTSEPVKEKSSAAVSESTVNVQESSGTQVESDVSKALESEDGGDDKPLYAHGKENIPALVATTLTALGTKDETTYNRCCTDEDGVHHTYQQLRSIIYKAIEQNGGDPAKDLTCADFYVYKCSVKGYTPHYLAYLKGCEEIVRLEIRAYTDDVDKQEYYLTIDANGYTDKYEDVQGYTVSCPFTDSEYTLVDLSQYKYKEVNENE